jgi:hypothetical protein
MKRELPERAIRVGAFTGTFAVASYLIWSVAPLPAMLNTVLHFAFGPLLVVAFLGIYHLLESYERRVLNPVAALYRAIGGVAFSFMTIVQVAMLRRVLPEYRSAPTEQAREAARYALEAINTVQLGMDVVWDIYITLATVLVGWALLRRPGFVRIYGGLGTLLGAATLVLNFWTFPTPPAEAGLFDLGPFVGLWFGGFCLLMFRGADPSPESPA